MARPRLSEQVTIEVQTESTYATSPTAGSPPLTLLDAFDIQVSPEYQFADRKGMQGSGRHFGAHGPRFATVKFSTHLFGLASTTWASTLLPACGIKLLSGTTYGTTLRSPEEGSSNTTSVTIRVVIDGCLHIISAAMGDMEIVATAGERLVANWTFTGRYTKASDLPLQTYGIPTATPIHGSGSTLTIASVAPVVQECKLMLNNVVAKRSSITSTLGGAYGCTVTQRDATLELLIEASLVATFDPEADLDAGTLRLLTGTFGGAGNQLIITVPKGQVKDVALQEDRNGILMQRLTYQCSRTAGSDGDDELGITLN